MKTELSKEELAIAQKVADGLKYDVIAVALGVSVKTIIRRVAKPEVAARIDQIKAKKIADAGQKLEKVGFGFTDAIEVLVKIARLNPESTKGEGIVQIKAIEMLDKMLKWSTSAPLLADGIDQAPKPTFYQSAWKQ